MNNREVYKIKGFNYHFFSKIPNDVITVKYNDITKTLKTNNKKFQFTLFPWIVQKFYSNRGHYHEKLPNSITNLNNKLMIKYYLSYDFIISDIIKFSNYELNEDHNIYSRINDLITLAIKQYIISISFNDFIYLINSIYQLQYNNTDLDITSIQTIKNTINNVLNNYGIDIYNIKINNIKSPYIKYKLDNLYYGTYSETNEILYLVKNGLLSDDNNLCFENIINFYPSGKELYLNNLNDIIPLANFIGKKEYENTDNIWSLFDNYSKLYKINIKQKSLYSKVK